MPRGLSNSGIAVQTQQAVHGWQELSVVSFKYDVSDLAITNLRCATCWENLTLIHHGDGLFLVA